MSTKHPGARPIDDPHRFDRTTTQAAERGSGVELGEQVLVGRQVDRRLTGGIGKRGEPLQGSWILRAHRVANGCAAGRLPTNRKMRAGPRRGIVRAMLTPVAVRQLADLRDELGRIAYTYACRPPGVSHGPFKSENGCLLFEIHYYDESGR